MICLQPEALHARNGGPEPPSDGSIGLYVIDEGGAEALVRSDGPAAVRRAIRRLRSSGGPALVAAPSSPDGAYDSWHADVLITELPVDPSHAAAHALERGVRSGGRPLLVDVRQGQTPAESLIAALDVGAAGALVRTGDADADRRFVREALELEAKRLEKAPLISVVVCNYNGARHLDACLASLAGLPYPRYEVIVCDDGSTDDSVAVARRHDVRVLELPHAGLSVARNRGVEAALGEIVVFLDGDAEARPGWLEGIWRLMDRLGVDGTGGPNLPFPEAGWQERVVSGAPGAAIPVVEPDGDAVHLAGCNMAFRRDLFARIGGFDPAFVSSTDDVEFCLRALDRGARLAFHPTAAVRHHRRDTVRGFLRQQRAYGESSVMDGAPERELMPGPRRSLLSRLNPLRPRYVLSGPQAQQLYTVTSQPLHVGLPVKALGAGLAVAAIGAPVAARRAQLAAWCTLCGAGVVALVGAVAYRAPVFAPAPGLPGIGQRLATAAVWFAMPVARSYGRRRARRRAAR